MLPIPIYSPPGATQFVMLVLAVIVVTQLVESVLLTPKIMADRSGLYPALVVISILFCGTALGGVVGMIVREHASHADEHVREAAAHGRQRADDVLERVTSYVREKPLMSIGTAFVAGVLYSSLMRRR